MTQDALVSFFCDEAVGLRSARQFAAVRSPECLSQEFDLALALRSYVLSGFPVIVPLDLRRMYDRSVVHGQTIFERNGIAPPTDSEFQRSGERRHAVLVVGCHRSEQYEFILHDPATFPFLKATAHQILAAAPSTHSGLAASSGSVILPVTDSSIRLPLLNVLPSGDREENGCISIGLLGISEVLHASWKAYRGPHFLPGDFRLVDFRGGFLTDSERSTQLQHLPAEARGKIMDLVERGVVSSWAWVQFKKASAGCASTICLWDATASGPDARQDPSQEGMQQLGDKALEEKYLLACIREDEERIWTRSRPGDRTYIAVAAPEVHAPHGIGGAPHRRRTPQEPARDKLKISLISSFTTRGLSSALEWWPDDPQPFCELYAFMQSDVLEILARRPGTALTQMSVLFREDPLKVKEAASRILEILEPKGISLCSLATFLPEAAFPPETNQALQACEALRFLLLLVRELQREHSSLRTIELVAGSRIAGIWKGRRATGQEGFVYVGNRLGDLEPIRHLLECVSQVADDAMGDPRICFAVELEPGYLYALRNKETLEEFVRQLDLAAESQPSLSRTVGLNLDVAHWTMAQIEPQWVRGNEAIKRRIVHAHVAGHQPGAHFGDIPLSDLCSSIRCLPWLDVLSEVANTPRGAEFPPFSGYVSLEYEAAKKPEFVRASLSELDFLVRSI